MRLDPSPRILWEGWERGEGVCVKECEGENIEYVCGELCVGSLCVCGGSVCVWGVCVCVRARVCGTMQHSADIHK